MLVVNKCERVFTMRQCKRCGRKGLFFFMTKDSLCLKCSREVERQKKEEEKALKIKMQEMAEKRRAGIAAFDDVPRVQIGTDGKKQKAQAVSFLKELTYSRVTAKSDPAKFGDFVVLDTETTGLSCTKDAVLEVAAIKVKNYKFVEVFHTMITPPAETFDGFCA